MILFDVNILVHAFREDAPLHSEMRCWLEERVYSEGAFGLSDLVLSGFLRVVTHPRVFDPPTPIEDALAFAESLRNQPNCVLFAAGRRHWGIFTRLCREAEAKGNLVPDAYLAALAIESGSEWITTDRDFSRFSGLKWSIPGR
jgi:hypothetical protein